ncbi:hypothetical protein GGF37_006444 [Kickxella alabastrina]|nr:hypothetical protein GGF37_006444 [Kickxella alabastrina]
MLGRLIPRTLRSAPLASAQYNGAGFAKGLQQQRNYSSDKDTPTASTTGNAATPSGESDKKSTPVSLSSLLESLNMQGNGSSNPSSGSSGLGKFSSLLSSGESPLKGDIAGFTGTGRFGGTAGRGRVEEDESDPMRMLILHVHASSNNTILSLTDADGRVLVNASGGTVGFRKAQRAGFEAAYQATASIATTIKDRGINVRKVELRLKGFGAGRDAAFKAVHSVTNWVVCRVVDTTPIPFNGCRPKKARRL